MRIHTEFFDIAPASRTQHDFGPTSDAPKDIAFMAVISISYCPPGTGRSWQPAREPATDSQIQNLKSNWSQRAS